jgi:AhpD family alkylhydroperoxidase
MKNPPPDMLVAKRTYTPFTWAGDVRALVRVGPRLLAIYRRGRVDGALRERVMVAVSRANACGACTRVHEAWALRAGASVEELEQIGAGELVLLPPESRAAVLYATALAESHFDTVPQDVRVLADAHLVSERQRDIEAIARLMTFANLSVNTVQTLASGLLRKRTIGARR